MPSITTPPTYHHHFPALDLDFPTTFLPAYIWVNSGYILAWGVSVQLPHSFMPSCLPRFGFDFFLPLPGTGQGSALHTTATCLLPGIGLDWVFYF